MNVDLVDGVDGGAGVGIRGQQGPLGIGINFSGLVEEADAIHMRHALIGQEQSYSIVSNSEFAQQFQSRIARVRSQHAIFLA